MTRRWLVLASALAACTPKVDTPAPSLTGVDPRLVCNAQLTTPVAVSGGNLTPLPVRTVGTQNGQGEGLDLPTLSLSQSAGLDGAAMSGAPVVLPDQPPAQSRVRWSSEMSMAFDVYPELMLSPGVYDLHVANPDGQKADLANALAVVPPPTVTSVQPSGICDEQMDVTVVVSGTGFLKVGGEVPAATITATTMGGVTKTYVPTMLGGCTPIATQVMAGVESCTTMTLLIPKMDLPPGSYTIVVTNPAPAACASTEAITLIVNPPPKLNDVLPKTICSGGGTLTAKGTGFQMGIEATVGPNTGSVSMVTDTDLTASFSGASMPYVAGMKYDLTVKNPDGCVDTLPQAVTAVQGPVLFFADPPGRL